MWNKQFISLSKYTIKIEGIGSLVCQGAVRYKVNGHKYILSLNINPSKDTWNVLWVPKNTQIFREYLKQNYGENETWDNVSKDIFNKIDNVKKSWEQIMTSIEFDLLLEDIKFLDKAKYVSYPNFFQQYVILDVVSAYYNSQPITQDDKIFYVAV